MISWAHGNGLQLPLNHSINWFGLCDSKTSLLPQSAKLLFCVCGVGFLLVSVSCY